MKSTLWQLIGLFILFFCAAFVNVWLVGVFVGLMLLGIGTSKEFIELKAPEEPDGDS